MNRSGGGSASTAASFSNNMVHAPDNIIALTAMFLVPMLMGVFLGFSNRRGKQLEPVDTERRNLAEAYFNRLAKRGISDQDLFARIMLDSEAFEHAVSVNKLHELIPELNFFEENPPDKDPNFYRPMPVMLHMFEAIRQTFGWFGSFGTEEYLGADARRNALLWINTALLFHDQGEIAIIKGTNLPLWYRFTVEWTKKQRKNILRETYPFFGIDTPEGRSYLNHLRHPEISAVLAAAPLLRLGWDSRAIRIVQFLVRNHSVLIEKATYGRLKDGRVLHEDLYQDIASVEAETGVAREDLLKMLQVVQIMDAKAIKPGMAEIPQETMMRVWMAYSYMNVVLTARSSERRCQTFRSYIKEFSRIRKTMPFGTPFAELFKELLCRIGEKDDSFNDEDRSLLEQELEYFERFEIVREDHIHINNQFNQLLHLVERRAGRKLSANDKILLLQAYKIAYRSHDGQFRRAFKHVPTGDIRRKYIEHPIKVAKIMVVMFGVTDPLTLAAVLFHDVLEDTDIDVADILAAFKNEDEKGRLISAVTLLTKPESRTVLKENLHKDLAYLTYIAGILTAGDGILNDRELFEWLRFILPRTKAADKIHNRRSLRARKPGGRIKEICRNSNTLVMFMESSNLTQEEKLKLLEEFDKSFFEIFSLLDFKKAENAQRFQASVSVFKQFVHEQLKGLEEKDPEIQGSFEEFDNSFSTLPQYLENPKTIVEKLKNLEKAVPHFCRKMGLDDRQTDRVIDEFALFLFNVSEVQWIADDGKRKIIRFQTIVRRFKGKIETGNWKPELTDIIDALARYVQGYPDIPPPIVRFGWLPDIFGLLSKLPVMRHWSDRFFGMKKRKLLARLLPRVAMLPIKNIYWPEGNYIKSIDRKAIEGRIGGLRVGNLSGRIVVTLHYPLFSLGLKSIFT